MKRIFSAFLAALFFATSVLAQVPIYTRPAGINQGAVAITGGTITGLSSPLPIASGGTNAITAQAASSNLAAGFILFKQGVPFIGLSSGSVSAVGAISAITALPFAYPKAYCYFPANALATSIAAGWYYCTFSTTTAGTAFLDTYTSGTPLVPASPTAVVDGKGAFVGNTATVVGPTFTLTGGTMGANGRISLIAHGGMTNSAGTKNLNPRFGGTNLWGGTNVTTQTAATWIGSVQNAGTASLQFLSLDTLIGGGSLLSGNGRSLGTVNSGSNVTIDVQMTRNTATDNFILEDLLLVLYADGV